MTVLFAKSVMAVLASGTLVAAYLGDTVAPTLAESNLHVPYCIIIRELNENPPYYRLFINLLPLHCKDKMGFYSVPQYQRGTPKPHCNHHHCSHCSPCSQPAAAHFV